MRLMLLLLMLMVLFILFEVNLDPVVWIDVSLDVAVDDDFDVAVKVVVAVEVGRLMLK